MVVRAFRHSTASLNGRAEGGSSGTEGGYVRVPLPLLVIYVGRSTSG